MADIDKMMNEIRKTTDSVSFSESKYGEVTDWISTGDLGLNRIISGSTDRGIPAGKVIVLGGESQCTPDDQTVQILSKKFDD